MGKERDNDGCCLVHERGVFSVWQRPIRGDNPPVFEVREAGFNTHRVVSLVALVDGGLDRAIADCNNRHERRTQERNA